MPFHVSFRLNVNSSFTAAYMTVGGCQVEPVGSQYEWERDPLPIIKDGCQSDSVGLVCPPERTDFGIRTKAEAFRYQTTAQVLYTCLIRVCPRGPCPQVVALKDTYALQAFCPPVEGCAGGSLLATAAGLRPPSFTWAQRSRARRQLPDFTSAANTFLSQALFGNTTATNNPFGVRPFDQSQAAQFAAALQQGGFGSGAPAFGSPAAQVNMATPPPAVQAHLDALAGDHVVTKKLIVMNSENELQYYLRTGSVPSQQLLTTLRQPQLYGRAFK